MPDSVNLNVMHFIPKNNPLSLQVFNMDNAGIRTKNHGK